MTGLPGEESFSSRRAHWIRDWKYPLLLETLIQETSAPLPLLFPISPWLDFLQACPCSLPVVPAHPNLLLILCHILGGPGKGGKGGLALTSMYLALPLDF